MKTSVPLSAGDTKRWPAGLNVSCRYISTARAEWSSRRNRVFSGCYGGCHDHRSKSGCRALFFVVERRRGLLHSHGPAPSGSVHSRTGCDGADAERHAGGGGADVQYGLCNYTRDCWLLCHHRCRTCIRQRGDEREVHRVRVSHGSCSCSTHVFFQAASARG